MPDVKTFLFLLRIALLRVPVLRPFIGAPRLLVLVRHAESARNQAHGGALFLSREAHAALAEVPDHEVPITPRGQCQGQIAGPRIAERFGRPDVVVTSGYRRTDETCDAAVGQIGWDGIVRDEDLRFRERESGYTHVLCDEEVETHFSFMKRYWGVFRGLFARPVGGESLLQMAEGRLSSGLRSLFRRHAGKVVWVFTHGRVIQMLRFVLERWSRAHAEEQVSSGQHSPPNCSATVYRYDPAAGELVLVEAYFVPWSREDLTTNQPVP